jgi:hypothetical protein
MASEFPSDNGQKTASSLLRDPSSQQITDVKPSVSLLWLNGISNPVAIVTYYLPGYAFPAVIN